MRCGHGLLGADPWGVHASRHRSGGGVGTSAQIRWECGHLGAYPVGVVMWLWLWDMARVNINDGLRVAGRSPSDFQSKPVFSRGFAEAARPGNGPGRRDSRTTAA